MSAQTGLAAINADVLSAINDMIGRVVLFNTADDRRWSGVLSAIGEDFQFGFELVVQVTKENENDLFRKEKDIIEKMEVPFEEIVDFAYVTEEDKKNQFVSKFATDRQYHGCDANGDEELEEWNGGDEEDGIGGSIEDDTATAGSQSSRRSNHNNAQTGWSPAEMFAANEYQVKSTFKEDLTQYTTAEIVGTDEDRARAERLAREIEANSSSRFMANLENDDDERDLDKKTQEEDFDNGNGRGKRSNYNQPPQQQRRNPNITPNGQPVNRRAEGLRGDRRNSGGSSANNSRYGPPAPSHNYQQPPPQQGQKGGSHNNRRQNEEYRENDWQMAKGKGQNQGQDHSFRQQQKQMLDPRPSAKQPEGEKGQGSGSRVTEMKKWGNEFSLGTPPKEQSPAPGSTPPAPQGNSGSAWNRGPPSSLVSKGTTSDSSSSANDKEQTEVSKTVTPRKEEGPSTSEEGRTEADGRHEEGDNESVHSETASVVTTKSQSQFKFNINAPEFKPRAAPTTPTPTTPTGPPPQGLAQIPPQQYVPPASEYQQHPSMIQHGGPLMGMPPNMAPHMPPGAVPQNQGQPMMMWQGQPGYQHNQQYQMQQGVPGQMYGQAAAAPMTVNQQGVQNPQLSANTSGGSQTDGRPQMQQMRRDGEFRDPQPLYFPSYNQPGQMVPVQQQQPFYNPQYQGAMQQQQYPGKMAPQQGPQGNYTPRYQQPQQVYIMPQGQPPQQYRHQGGPPQQAQQFSADQGTQQSHPNSQPTTPGPRGGEMNGQKGQQQAPPQPQSNNNGMQREPEAGSNASLSGSASSQSGQRSGSPHANAAVPSQQPQQQQQQPPQHQQGPPHGAPQHGGPQHGTPQHPIPPHVQQVPGSMVGMPQYMMVPQHQMHQHMTQYYAQQPAMYYNMPQMMPVQQMPMQANQHGQQSLMGERADNGFAQNNFFDYRNIPNFQHTQQQHQMHGNQMPRQNSIPQQQFGGNQVLKV